jgi:ribosomal protein S18 acetylase RimI-like enzyme
MEIRFLTADDAPVYSLLRLEMLERDPEAFSSSVEEHRALSLDEIEERLRPDPENRFVVGAFLDGELVGAAGFFRDRGPKLRHRGHVWGVYVNAKVRGQGISRNLMTVLLNRARTIQGVEQVMLGVTTTQTAAAALYRSLGFQSFGLERRALKIGDRYVDEEYLVLPMTNSYPR